jgi:hypothetical protein
VIGLRRCGSLNPGFQIPGNRCVPNSSVPIRSLPPTPAVIRTHCQRHVFTPNFAPLRLGVKLRISKTNPISPAQPTVPNKTFQTIMFQFQDAGKLALFGFVIGFDQPSGRAEDLPEPFKLASYPYQPKLALFRFQTHFPPANHKYP